MKSLAKPARRSWPLPGHEGGSLRNAEGLSQFRGATAAAPASFTNEANGLRPIQTASAGNLRAAQPHI